MEGFELLMYLVFGVISVLYFVLRAKLHSKRNIEAKQHGFTYVGGIFIKRPHYYIRVEDGKRFSINEFNAMK